MEQRQYSIKCLLLGVTFALGIGVIPTFAQYPEAIPPYEVVNPYVPSKMVFAGDTLDLQRADLHERIDRELITFTFGHTISSTLDLTGSVCSSVPTDIFLLLNLS